MKFKHNLSNIMKFYLMAQGFVGASLMNLDDASVRNFFLLVQIGFICLCTAMFRGTKVILQHVRTT